MVVELERTGQNGQMFERHCSPDGWVSLTSRSDEGWVGVEVGFDEAFSVSLHLIAK